MRDPIRWDQSNNFLYERQGSAHQERYHVWHTRLPILKAVGSSGRRIRILDGADVPNARPVSSPVRFEVRGPSSVKFW
jgi:hypothetical protein